MCAYVETLSIAITANCSVVCCLPPHTHTHTTDPEGNDTNSFPFTHSD